MKDNPSLRNISLKYKYFLMNTFDQTQRKWLFLEKRNIRNKINSKQWQEVRKKFSFKNHHTVLLINVLIINQQNISWSHKLIQIWTKTSAAHLKHTQQPFFQTPLQAHIKQTLTYFLPLLLSSTIRVCKHKQKHTLGANTRHYIRVLVLSVLLPPVLCAVIGVVLIIDPYRAQFKLTLAKQPARKLAVYIVNCSKRVIYIGTKYSSLSGGQKNCLTCVCSLSLSPPSPAKRQEGSDPPCKGECVCVLSVRGSKSVRGLPPPLIRLATPSGRRPDSRRGHNNG